MYSKFPAITKTTPANHVTEILQPHSFINTSTNPDGSHMHNYIRQIEVNIANEPPAFQCLGEYTKQGIPGYEHTNMANILEL